MTEQHEPPFHGDYHQARLGSSPGFINPLETGGSAVPHFSPATSEHSYHGVSLAPSRPTTSGSAPPPTSGAGDMPMTVRPHGPSPVQAQYHPHTPGGYGGGHSFSSASLPSLAGSASTSYSFAHVPPHHPAYLPPGMAPHDYSPGAHMHMYPDHKGIPINPAMTPHPSLAMSPNVGLGMGIGIPQTPMSGTLPPALLGRSPAPGMMPGLPPGMGKMPYDRHRFARPSPYHVQSSRSNSLSVKSEDEELMSMYSGTSGASYQSAWSGAGMIGDMGQMSLEHRRSNSTPFDLPPMGPPLFGRSRARSFSVGKSSTSLEFLDEELELAGPAGERESQIRSDLSSKAEQVRALSPCQHGKARAVWAKRWLKLSYTPVNGFTVPRQGLYHSYTMSCNDFGLRPINSASFGKVVRSTFLGIRTRRLGVRGNSKYHYVSLRPAISTEAHRLNAYGDSSGQLHVAPQEGDYSGADEGGHDVLTEDDTEEDEDDDLAELSEHSMTYSSHPFPSSHSTQYLSAPDASRSRTPDDPPVIRSARAAHIGLQAATAGSGVSSGASTEVRLGSPGADRALPPFPSLSPGYNPAVTAFWQQFCANHEHLARCVSELAFERFERTYRNFWESLPAETLLLCAQPPLAAMLVDGMAMSYDHIILTLVDKILAPVPAHAHAALGMLSNTFEKITADSLGGLAVDVSRPIILLSREAGQLFGRFLDLLQITAAVGPILSEPEHVAAMRTSWRLLDSNFVVSQCALACDCSEAIIEPALLGFTAWLNDVGANPAAHPIEQLAACIDTALARAEGAVSSIAKIHGIIPRASYLTSQVMRLLTLRSDMSFGWFQLLKTWIDDYVTLACMRRAAFAPVSLRPPPFNPNQLHLNPLHVPLQPGAQLHPAPLPTLAPLAIDTGAAGYAAVAVDQSAITPRPAFTASGAATSATGPGVQGIAGPSGMGVPTTTFL